MKAQLYNFFTGQKLDLHEAPQNQIVHIELKPQSCYLLDLKNKKAETKKAIAFYLTLTEQISDSYLCNFVTNIYWLPKSQLECYSESNTNCFVPGWILLAKAKEIFDKILKQDSNLIYKIENGLYDSENIFVLFENYKITLGDYLK